MADFDKSVFDGAELVKKSKQRLFKGYESQLLDIMIQGYTFFGYEMFKATFEKLLSFIEAAEFPVLVEEVPESPSFGKF